MFQDKQSTIIKATKHTDGKTYFQGRNVIKINSYLVSEQLMSKIFLIWLVIWISPLTSSCKFNGKIIFPNFQINKNIESKAKKLKSCHSGKKKNYMLATTMMNFMFVLCKQTAHFSLSPNSSERHYLNKISPLFTQFMTTKTIISHYMLEHIRSC